MLTVILLKLMSLSLWISLLTVCSWMLRWSALLLLYIALLLKSLNTRHAHLVEQLKIFFFFLHYLAPHEALRFLFQD